MRSSTALTIQDFLVVFQPYALKSPEGVTLRKRAFSKAVTSNNKLSQSDAISFIRSAINAASNNGKEAALLFKTFHPCYHHAFRNIQMVKEDYVKSNNEKLKGKRNQTGRRKSTPQRSRSNGRNVVLDSDSNNGSGPSILFSEFRIFNMYLCIYAVMLEEYILSSRGGLLRFDEEKQVQHPGINLESFLKGYSLVSGEHSIFKAFSGVNSDDIATSLFQRIADGKSTNKEGCVLFPTWAEFIRLEEIRNNTDIGKLLNGYFQITRTPRWSRSPSSFNGSTTSINSQNSTISTTSSGRSHRVSLSKTISHRQISRTIVIPRGADSTYSKSSESTVTDSDILNNFSKIFKARKTRIMDTCKLSTAHVSQQADSTPPPPVDANLNRQQLELLQKQHALLREKYKEQQEGYTLLQQHHDQQQLELQKLLTIGNDNLANENGGSNKDSNDDPVINTDSTVTVQNPKHQSHSEQQQQQPIIKAIIHTPTSITKKQSPVQAVTKQQGVAFHYNGKRPCHDTFLRVESIVFDPSISEIGREAFSLCTSLTSVNIPSSMVAIRKWAFASCTNLLAVEIPSSMITIEEHAFSYCTSLKTLILPSSVKAIGKDTFKECSNLDENSLQSISDWFTKKLRLRDTFKEGPGSQHDFKGHTQSSWGPEWWGITIDQIENILKHPFINDDTLMRDVVELAIKPVTRKCGVGYALLLNQDKPLRANVMVSYALDGSIGQFIACLRNTGKKGPFWVCAFSMYHSDDESDRSTIKEQLEINPTYGTCAVVLRGADLMLVVVTAMCDINTRLWCVYEIFIAQMLNVDVKLCSYVQDIGQGLVESDVCIATLKNSVDSKKAECGRESDKTNIHTEILKLQNGFEEINEIVEKVRLQYLWDYPVKEIRTKWERKGAVELLASCIILMVNRIYSIGVLIPDFNVYCYHEKQFVSSPESIEELFEKWKKNVELLVLKEVASRNIL